MIKLIATDMDGTLLNEHGCIPDNFEEILNKLKDNKIKFVVASGRPYYTLRKNFGHLSDSLSYICENGSLVIDDNKTIYKSVMKDDIVKEIIKAAKSLNDNALILCAEECAYIEHYSEKHMNEIKKYYTNIEIVSDLSEVTDDIIKIAICNLNDTRENYNSVFNPKFSNNLNVVMSGDVWIDVSNPGVNKGLALTSLMDADNITSEETMVFGDYYNDVQMLKRAKYSFVMENAPEDMKQYGNFIAKKNTENGVIDAIINYALNS